MFRTISMVSYLTIWNFGSLFAWAFPLQLERLRLLSGHYGGIINEEMNDVLDTLEYISEHVDKKFMDDINSPVGR